LWLADITFVRLQQEFIYLSEAVPQMVYRRMNFPDGVPVECKWTNSHEVKKTQKGEW